MPRILSKGLLKPLKADYDCMTFSWADHRQLNTRNGKCFATITFEAGNLQGDL